MALTIPLGQAKEHIVTCIKHKLVPMISGSPAIGKSSIVHQIAKEFNLLVIDLRLSQCDPTDLLGFPSLLENMGRYLPMETFPIEGDVIPKGYNGWLLFMDEFNSANKDIQAAAYKIVLDRMVGIHKLHPNVAVVCAGNLETDGAIVEEMSTAMQSRLIHFEVHVDSKEWLDWAASKNIDHRITSYIRFKPGVLYTFSPEHTDKTYASPRTWEFASRYTKGMGQINHTDLPLLAGTISEGVAREFLSFTKVFSSLPSISKIISDPEGIAVPEEPSVLYALTGSIAHHMDLDNAGNLLKYLNRMPIEFQVVTLREAVKRNPSLASCAPVVEWFTSVGQELYS